MKEKGMPVSDVMRRLEMKHSRDVSYSSGRIMGSMCTSPHPIALEAHELFRESNLGNPGLYPGTSDLEESVIKEIGQLLNHPSPRGNFLSGGTEANITAIYLARSMTKKRKIAFPKSAHFSVIKAVKLLDMEPLIVDLDDDYRMSVDSLEDLMDDDVSLVLTVAGTTEIGTVDPIEKVSEIVGDIPLHVDAAFGGFVLPFLERMGKLPTWVGKWDFRSEGVTSMSTDPHKMGMSTIPAGCLLYTEDLSLEKLSVDSPYLTSKNSYTLAGTRDSGSVAACYAAMNHLGMEGYMKIVEDCMSNTRYLMKRLEEYSLEPLIDPVMNILVVRHPDPHGVEKRLFEMGWNISVVRDPPSLRFVLMPHVTKESIDRFIPDLEIALDSI